MPSAESPRGCDMAAGVLCRNGMAENLAPEAHPAPAIRRVECDSNPGRQGRQECVARQSPWVIADITAGANNPGNDVRLNLPRSRRYTERRPQQVSRGHIYPPGFVPRPDKDLPTGETEEEDV